MLSSVMRVSHRQTNTLTCRRLHFAVRRHLWQTIVTMIPKGFMFGSLRGGLGSKATPSLFARSQTVRMCSMTTIGDRRGEKFTQTGKTLDVSTLCHMTRRGFPSPSLFAGGSVTALTGAPGGFGRKSPPCLHGVHGGGYLADILTLFSTTTFVIV